MYRTASIVVLALLACKGNTTSAPVPDLPPPGKPAAKPPALPAETAKPERVPTPDERSEDEVKADQARERASVDKPKFLAIPTTSEAVAYLGNMGTPIFPEFMAEWFEKKKLASVKTPRAAPGYAVVREAPEKYAGQWLCFNGSIKYMLAVGSATGAQLVSGKNEALAVTKSPMGALKIGSTATFCGVITRDEMFVILAGMFDIPENR